MTPLSVALGLSGFASRLRVLVVVCQPPPPTHLFPSPFPSLLPLHNGSPPGQEDLLQSVHTSCHACARSLSVACTDAHLVPSLPLPVGAGYVGGPTASVIALKAPHMYVVPALCCSRVRGRVSDCSLPAARCFCRVTVRSPSSTSTRPGSTHGTRPTLPCPSTSPGSRTSSEAPEVATSSSRPTLTRLSMRPTSSLSCVAFPLLARPCARTRRGHWDPFARVPSPSSALPLIS